MPVNAIVLEQKDGEVGKFVITAKYTVKAENLAEFQELMAVEYVRAVKEASGVVGMFLTAEQANPNIFHVMNIFAEESDFRDYTKSENYKILSQKIKNMIQTEKVIDYLPTKITLTNKGSRI